MSDLVARLRSFYSHAGPVAGLLPIYAADEIERLRASVAAIHWRLKFGLRIDSHTISVLIAECEHAVPALIGIEPPNV